MNLVVNARDAMPQGGKLTMETANVELDTAYARTHPVAAGPYVMLAVTDTGCGMDTETQGKIFNPFFTTKEKGRGTGLGLSTVYGIVKQSGGYVWVYSELGRGTTFKVYLPQVQEVATAVKPSTTTTLPSKGTETILVVEDEEAVRRLVSAVLESSGYKLLIARQGDEAFSLADGHKGPIKLLLTDMVMPGISGPELAGRLTAGRPEMKVLYMSGYTDDTVVRHHLLDPDTPFLQKPFKTESLARKVREVLDVGKGEER
jgi:CheY-like chemotaxis protein